MNRLKEKYEKVIKPELISSLGIKNAMAVPVVEKVVLNIGVGEAATKKEVLEPLSKDLAAITGQKPSVRNAKISVAGFGIRAGSPVGLSVTLRGDRMYSFLDKLYSVVLPRLRDFRGLAKRKFDKSGNYTLGLTEQTVFPEVDVTKTANVKGLEITIVTNTKDPEKSFELLSKLGMPFEKD